MTSPVGSSVPHPGITFAVDDVKPILWDPVRIRSDVYLERRLKRPLLGCSHFKQEWIIGDECGHGLITAAFTAFSHHRPLVLSPDMIWLAIAQGFARHVNIHAEILRSCFVGHRGKLDLTVTRHFQRLDSPDNAWMPVIAELCRKIADHIGRKIHDLLQADFSTTGPIERAVSGIVLMDAFQPYFRYICCCICGIPSITLEGTERDWAEISRRVQFLRGMDIDLNWWLDPVSEICAQFECASRGDVDRPHWQNLIKRYDEEYGAATLNGWILKLIPYLKDNDEEVSERNWLLTNERAHGIFSSRLPKGMSYVPFTCTSGRVQEEPAILESLEFIGGFTGVAMDDQTEAVRPVIGWAVCPEDKWKELLYEFDHQPYRWWPERPHDRVNTTLNEVTGNTICPPAFQEFYAGHAELHIQDRHSDLTLKMLPPWELAAVELAANPIEDGAPQGLRASPQRWWRFAELTNGMFLLVSENPVVVAGEAETALDFCHPVIACTNSGSGPHRIIALSFPEFLTKAMAWPRVLSKLLENPPYGTCFLAYAN